ncbi:MAG: glutamine synthetase type III [Bacteroidetes bacterium]|jgi:glutamine synthetase|nr:glutamine synthetase type III [Bacteroidota bacterium]
MSSNRNLALQTALNRVPVSVLPPSVKVSDYYNINVFNDNAMKSYLSKSAYKAVSNAIIKGEKIDRAVAEEVAAGMKSWAINRGATHYTHWFQPLTGATAEKHDAFFEPTEDGRSMEIFSGNALVQQEPDASSFPNGGIRNTFEARGYTAWDPSSPAFIMEGNNGKTLCIPTIFVSYTGEALDYKAPLLKALHAVENAVVSVCSNYFDKNVTKAYASLGIEQEYFLVDEALFYARPDLMLTGRTLLGQSPEKGQQLEDHYFGSIPPRVHDFMVDLETESYKLGIPLKTRHNEVAPSQFECAPNFEEANLAIDHNQLLMDLMEKVGKKHGFKVLLHEKPFSGINGSGKHNNWSLITNTGVNLLAPTKNPETNLQFLTFFVNVIKGVFDNADLLRASIASAGNDHRLGANEAPPAIMSIFIGSQMTHILESLLGGKTAAKSKKAVSIDVIKIPEILLDNTDRNRTSPFAFTGNKFEFRAVGSSANCANANIVLNTVMASQLNKFQTDVNALVKKGRKQEKAILEVLKTYYNASKNILFEGNGYGDEWVKEAEKRGLSNVKTTPEALNAYVSQKSKDLFVKNNIFNAVELEARYEIMQEIYVKKIDIEAKILAQLATSHIIPSAIEYQGKLASNVASLKAAGLSKSLYDVQVNSITEIAKHVKIISDSVTKLISEGDKAHHIEDTHKKAISMCHKVKPLFDTIRKSSDALEFMIEDDLWKLPKYRELLFVK